MQDLLKYKESRCEVSESAQCFLQVLNTALKPLLWEEIRPKATQAGAEKEGGMQVSGCKLLNIE